LLAQSRAARQLSALAAAVLIALAATTAVAAAEPPFGVVFDASITVEVRSPAGEGGAVLAGAEVIVVSYVSDFPEEQLQDPVEGTTGADGTVTLSGLARADEGGPEVHLAVDVRHDTSRTDAQNCVIGESRLGSATDIVSPPAEPVVIEAPLQASSIECPPASVLEGTVVDGDGNPIEVDFAQASILVPPAGGAQSFPLEVSPNGAFSVQLPAWGTLEQPAEVSISVMSTPTRTEPFGADCLRTFVESGAVALDLALADGESIPFVEIVTEEIVLGERCGVRGTPPPDNGGGNAPQPTTAPVATAAPAATAAPVVPTLPATDGVTTTGERSTSSVAPAVVLVLALAVVLLAVAPRRRRS
jgi:hypothetical protein